VFDPRADQIFGLHRRHSGIEGRAGVDSQTVQ
jgi:hypothetical protein